MDCDNIEGQSILENAMSDDESNSTEDDQEDDAKDLEQIEILNKKIESSPYLYQAHIERITLLRKCGEFEQLHSARKSMAKMFPLTQELWLNWLEDEQKFAESEDEHEQLEKLFETAIQDYMCPKIWLEYAQYSIRFVVQDGGFDKLHSMLERALSATGLHVSQGAAVWEAYREIENAILASVQLPPGSVATAQQNDIVTNQISRISSLFARQLAVPLVGMEETMEEYEEWRKSMEDGEVNQQIRDSYAKALKLLDDLMPFEKALESKDKPNIETYESYIAFEKKSNDPARVQCIYERAIADNCLNADLWHEYLQYLIKTLKSGPVVLSAHERAVRNCPWSSNLWQNLLLALEKSHSSIEKLESVLDEALTVGFSSPGDYAFLWQAWCDLSRRKYCDGPEKEKDELAKYLRGSFERATTHLLNTVFPAFNDSGDPDYTLWSYWASCEAKYLKNMNKARQILDNMMADDIEARRKWSIWKEYYDIERLYGDEEHARAVLRHAVQSSAADDGSAESACTYLVRFERENGNLEDLEDARRKVDNRLAKVQKRKEKVATQMQEKKKRWEQNGQVKKRWKKEDHKKSPDKPRPKRTMPQDTDSEAAPPKRSKTESIQDKDNFKAPSSLPIRFVKPSPKPKEEASELTAKIVAPPPGFKPNEASSDASKSQTFERTPESEARTVFLSNLSYEFKNIEERLKQIFSPCGSIASIRLVHGNKGDFRGYAYVEFEDKSSIPEALKLDRTPVEGRPMFVSPNVDKSKHPDFKVFKYSKGMEKHKLFISGLCFDTPEEKLREVFAAHGPLVSVRIVTARSGKSKGLAYVEYEKEADAALAVLKTDETEIDGFTIKVAISNPPSRNRPVEDRTRALGGGARSSVGGRGKGRTQVSLIPRSLQQSSAKSTSASGSNPQTSSDDKGSVTSKPMSNKDFSKLFLNK